MTYNEENIVVNPIPQVHRPKGISKELKEAAELHSQRELDKYIESLTMPTWLWDNIVALETAKEAGNSK